MSCAELLAFAANRMPGRGNPLEPYVFKRFFTPSGTAGFFPALSLIDRATARAYDSIDMPLITSQQLAHYYQQYRAIDVTFNKEVSRALGLVPRQVYFKCLGSQVPCIIYASSLNGARIIANLDDAMYDRIRRANNVISLRYCFKQLEKSAPLAFFVAAKVVGYNPYGSENKNLNFISLEFTQRPPDDLIAILGRMLDTNANSQKRRGDRIVISEDVMRKMGLKAREAVIYIDNLPRKCMLRDLSFGGAKVIIPGVAKFIVNKPVILRISIEVGQINLPGKTVRFEEVQGRRDIAAFAIQFSEDHVPMEYKMMVSEYLASVKLPGGS